MDGCGHGEARAPASHCRPLVHPGPPGPCPPLLEDTHIRAKFPADLNGGGPVVWVIHVMVWGCDGMVWSRNTRRCSDVGMRWCADVMLKRWDGAEAGR
eukprot:315554-Chlamydomonas_euryale.AAC.7